MNTNTARDLSKPNEKDKPLSQILSTRKSARKGKPVNDELIVTLSDAPENKRARQVIEWERMGRAAAYHSLH